MDRQTISDQIANSSSSTQWKKIGVRHHHGIAVPLFSLHSTNSCGIGEYPDLIPLINWCPTVGLDTIQLLPLNDTGGDTSPYNAISAFALNPFHIGLTSLPYLSDHPELIAEIMTIPKNEGSLRVNYTLLREHKNSFLRNYFHKTREKIVQSQNYQEFLARSSWLKGYSLYKILKNRFEHQSWENWPMMWRNPTPELLDQLTAQETNALEYEYVIQYLCDYQLHAVKEIAESKGIFLMGDIPILISRDSADVWINGDLFLLEYSSGAPPDMYSIEGQNWGSPIYNWEVVSRQQYRWWIDRLNTASRYYQIYRVDHVVGFFRIWSIPQGLKSSQGHFIPEDPSIWNEHGRKILEIMLQNCEMLPIGEDLGIIPTETRKTLADLGICGTKVMRWERNWDQDGLYIPPHDYKPLGMTTVSTHDSETLQLWWKNQPIEAQLYAKSKGWAYQPELSLDNHTEILKASHHTGNLFHINLLQEYLALFPELTWAKLEDQRINIPGIISDENWSVRFKPSVEEIVNHEGLRLLMQKLIGET